MIRVIDEPVFEMTAAEYARLLAQYQAQVMDGMWDMAPGPIPPSFEQWLMHYRQLPHTVQGRIKP